MKFGGNFLVSSPRSKLTPSRWNAELGSSFLAFSDFLSEPVKNRNSIDFVCYREYRVCVVVQNEF